jgi:hypothetical protein
MTAVLAAWNLPFDSQATEILRLFFHGTQLAYTDCPSLAPEEQKKRRRAKDGQASSRWGCPPGDCTGRDKDQIRRSVQLRILVAEREQEIEQNNKKNSVR